MVYRLYHAHTYFSASKFRACFSRIGWNREIKTRGRKRINKINLLTYSLLVFLKMQIIARPKFQLKCMRHYLDRIHLSSQDSRIQQIKKAPTKRFSSDFLAFTTCPNQLRSAYRQVFNYMQARKIDTETVQGRCQLIYIEHVEYSVFHHILTSNLLRSLHDGFIEELCNISFLLINVVAFYHECRKYIFCCEHTVSC